MSFIDKISQNVKIEAGNLKTFNYIKLNFDKIDLEPIGVK